MTIEQIRDMVSGKDYDFLRENEHLGDRIIFLTLGGSYSYGTNVETSDVDIRGCALNSKSDLLGLSNFEQVVIRKLIRPFIALISSSLCYLAVIRIQSKCLDVNLSIISISTTSAKR